MTRSAAFGVHVLYGFVGGPVYGFVGGPVYAAQGVRGVKLMGLGRWARMSPSTTQPEW